MTLSTVSLGQKIKFIEIYNENGLLEKKKSNDNNTNNQINKVYLSNIENGYLSTTVDSSHIYDQTLFIYINSGERYENSRIQIKIPDDIDLKLAHSFEKKSIYFNPSDFQKKINNWLNIMNNNGFPFAEFELKESNVSNSKIELDCRLSTGPYVTIDTLINPEINKKEWNLLSNITDIKKGSAFNLR